MVSGSEGREDDEMTVDVNGVMDDTNGIQDVARRNLMVKRDPSVLDGSMCERVRNARTDGPGTCRRGEWRVAATREMQEHEDRASAGPIAGGLWMWKDIV